MTTQHEARVTAADRHLAEVISAIFDKPIPLEQWDVMLELIARHRAQSMLEGARVMQEAAAKVAGYPAVVFAVYGIDPATIIAEHRAKEASNGNHI